MPAEDVFLRDIRALNRGQRHARRISGEEFVVDRRGWHIVVRKGVRPDHHLSGDILFFFR